jgi:hypothetical protein
MEWTLKFHEDFQAEYEALGEDVQDELLAEAKYVRKYGPETSRPHVDTLNGSKFANMKELRFEAADGEWRAAFAFDPKREAILLVAADKSGVSEKKFYKRLIDKADARYAQHLEKLKAEEKAEAAKKAAAKPVKKKGKK